MGVNLELLNLLSVMNNLLIVRNFKFRSLVFSNVIEGDEGFVFSIFFLN